MEPFGLKLISVYRQSSQSVRDIVINTAAGCHPPHSNSRNVGILDQFEIIHNHLIYFRPRRSRSAAAYSHQTFPCTICRSVCLSVCPVHCGKTTDRSRQPFGIIGRTGPRMRQVLGFANWSTGRGTFGGELGPHHCNQWGLYGVHVRQCLNRRRCGLG